MEIFLCVPRIYRHACVSWISYVCIHIVAINSVSTSVILIVLLLKCWWNLLLSKCHKMLPFEFLISQHHWTSNVILSERSSQDPIAQHDVHVTYICEVHELSPKILILRYVEVSSGKWNRQFLSLQFLCIYFIRFYFI